MVDRLICFTLTVKHRHKIFLCWDFFSIGMGTQKKSKLDKENFHMRVILTEKLILTVCIYRRLEGEGTIRCSFISSCLAFSPNKSSDEIRWFLIRIVFRAMTSVIATMRSTFQMSISSAGSQVMATICKWGMFLGCPNKYNTPSHRFCCRVEDFNFWRRWICNLCCRRWYNYRYSFIDLMYFALVLKRWILRHIQCSGVGRRIRTLLWRHHSRDAFEKEFG
jgi:hypothetical protein